VILAKPPHKLITRNVMIVVEIHVSERFLRERNGALRDRLPRCCKRSRAVWVAANRKAKDDLQAAHHPFELKHIRPDLACLEARKDGYRDGVRISDADNAHRCDNCAARQCASSAIHATRDCNVLEESFRRGTR
jgi:hypothetical protein